MFTDTSSSYASSSLTMPAVASGKVLVTGATGFVAGGVIESLLKHGYSVRATVRSESKGAPLLEKLAEYRDKLELAIVEDMVKASSSMNEHLASHLTNVRCRTVHLTKL